MFCHGSNTVRETALRILMFNGSGDNAREPAVGIPKFTESCDNVSEYRNTDVKPSARSTDV